MTTSSPFSVPRPGLDARGSERAHTNRSPVLYLPEKMPMVLELKQP